MTQTFGLLLADKVYVREVGNSLDLLIDLLLVLFALEVCLKLEGVIKVILDNTLAPVCYDENILNSGGNCLLNYILNSRLVNDIEHLLGNCL